MERLRRKGSSGARRDLCRKSLFALRIRDAEAGRLEIDRSVACPSRDCPVEEAEGCNPEDVSGLGRTKEGQGCCDSSTPFRTKAISGERLDRDCHDHRQHRSSALLSESTSTHPDSESETPVAQARQTQALPLFSGGILSSTSWGIVTYLHQQSDFPAAIPQSFGLPQSGQIDGSTAFSPSPAPVSTRSPCGPALRCRSSASRRPSR